MTKSNGTLSWRVGELEAGYTKLDGKIDIILQNHLPHLHEEISSLKTRISVLTAVNVGAIIIGILITKYL